jgi:Xaa-Pro aminopeptidase
VPSPDIFRRLSSVKDGYDFHEFPEDEYRRRYERARSLMAESGLDALLVSEENNYRYFTGHLPPTRNRPTLFVLPMEGSPLILAATYGSAAARQMSWVRNILEYEAPLKAEYLRETLLEAGLDGKVIGTEAHDRFFGAAGMGVSHGEYDRLQQQMPGTVFRDASKLIWRLRMIKSDLERECLAKVCEITGRAYQRTFSEARPGMTESRVGQVLISAMMDEGADLPSQGRRGPCAFLIVDASRPLGQLHAPTDKPLEWGDLLHIDTGAIYNGYCADFARLATVGPPSSEQSAQWRQVRHRMDQALGVVRAGNRLGDISVHWHGVGLDGVEPPFVGNHDELLMERGMVLALEEIIYSNSGETYHLEENVIVTDDGYELLTEIDSGLYVIADGG